MHHESHKRSIVKAISWKLIAAVLAFATSYALTRDAGFAAQFTGTWTIIGLIAYYFHERLWNNIQFGKEPLADTEHKSPT